MFALMSFLCYNYWAFRYKIYPPEKYIFLWPCPRGKFFRNKFPHFTHHHTIHLYWIMFSFNINDIYDAIPYHDRSVPFLKQSPKSLLMLLLMIGGNVQLNPGPQNVKKKNIKKNVIPNILKIRNLSVLTWKECTSFI